MTLEYAAPALPHLLGYGFFLTKIGGYLFYKPHLKSTPDMSAAVVIPVYNEDPVLFSKCLDRVLSQSHPPDEVYVVDDASTSSTCYDIACARASNHHRFIVHRFERNQGKRAAHQWAVLRSRAAVLVNIDSDVVVGPDALAEALKPFSNPDIQGVSTRATASNQNANWLTRYLGNILISQDFDRAALSFFDSAYAAGRFILFRTQLFKKHMDEYVNESFLGNRLRSGDDACMVRLALRYGRVVYQETAHSEIRVADHVNIFVRQFLRWERNTLRTNLNILREFRPARPFWWFNAMDIFVRLLFGPAFVVAAVLSPAITLKSFGIFYLIVLLLLLRRKSSLPTDKIGWTWLIATPVVKIIQSLIATPVRLYALVTIRRDSWGTR